MTCFCCCLISYVQTSSIHLYSLLLMLFYRLDILTHINRPGHRLPVTPEEKDYVTGRFTAAESMNLPKVQLRRIETGKEVR